jgi:serine protease DegS
MIPGRLGRSAIFLAGAVVGGLALAFIVVFFKPELLQRMPLKPATLSSPPATVPATVGFPMPAADGPDGTAPDSTSASTVLAAPLHRFGAAVRRAAPAVVNIYTRRVVVEQVRPSGMDQFFGDFWPRMQQRVQGALGSGVIVDEAGHIVTNNHVIANATVINVQLADGRVAQAKVVGRDPDTDLAVLVIKLARLPVMTLGRSDRLQVGDDVLAIGNPLGLQQTVTHGIVSATGRNQLNIATFENFIQTDAAINEGNSGGALVDANGELIGINTAVIAKNLDTTGVEGIGFAIPVNLVRGVMHDILDHGRVVRGWTGIVPEDFSAELAAQNGLVRGGVVITNLYRDSPAAAAGLRPGDILLSVNEREVTTAQEALKQLATQKPGGEVKLRVQRGTVVTDVKCKVIERPSQV